MAFLQNVERNPSRYHPGQHGKIERLQARGKLPEQLFERLLAWTSKRCDEATNGAWIFKGRLVEMVDGWTVTMADTKENQQQYPQMKSQKPGCGFPIARMIGLFSLATGSIQFNALAPYQGKQTGETSLLRTIIDRILPGRILLADRYYATFWEVLSKVVFLIE